MIKQNKFYLTTISLILFVLHIKYHTVSANQNVNLIETCQDEKCFKGLLKTRPNLLVLFSKSDANAKDQLRLLKEVSVSVKSFATIAYVNCDSGKKLCKKYKINPNPTELNHFSDGVFNKNYDRQFTKKSLENFLRDPKGDKPWEEEENAKDVVHLNNANELNKLLKKAKLGVLIMFYAPWCGFCKKLKPDYSVAASELKQIGILAAIDLDRSENYQLKEAYNITGFPTLYYFKSGKLLHPYGGEYTKESLVSWMKNPMPPKEKEPEQSWADEADMHVTFLTTDIFDSFIKSNPVVLVMFFAPWCGHCKNMKPVFNRVAKRLKEENSKNIIAFVDATKENLLAEKFKVKGYPTVKLFKDGQYAWDYNERSEEKVLEYMRNPAEPPPEPKPEPKWKDEQSFVVHADSANFASVIKNKKHALAFFYAPWCGHCKNAKPHYTEAAAHYKDDPKTVFVAVDCTEHQAICKTYDVNGYPTIIYFSFGKNPKPYQGQRDKEAFIKFMANPQATNEPKQDENTNKDPKDDWKDIAGHQHIHFLDQTNFDEFIQNKKKVLVMFYAPWCGHCKNMKPAYGQAASEITSFVPGSYLVAIDATKQPSLAQRFKVDSYPTLKYFENGKFMFDYEMNRSKEDFVNFMREPKKPKSEL